MFNDQPNQGWQEHQKKKIVIGAGTMDDWPSGFPLSKKILNSICG
jgi:hypothetical protein